jgi:VanZ family protein
MRTRSIFIVLACIIVPAIAILSFLPSGDKDALHTAGRFHYLGHFLIFSLIAYVLGRTSRSRQTRVILFFSTLVFGLGLELAEHLIYLNALEWMDVAVDSAGAVAGTVIAFHQRATAPAR